MERRMIHCGLVTFSGLILLATVSGCGHHRGARVPDAYYSMGSKPSGLSPSAANRSANSYSPGSAGAPSSYYDPSATVAGYDEGLGYASTPGGYNPQSSLSQQSYQSGVIPQYSSGTYGNQGGAPASQSVYPSPSSPGLPSPTDPFAPAQTPNSGSSTPTVPQMPNTFPSIP